MSNNCQAINCNGTYVNTPVWYVNINDLNDNKQYTPDEYKLIPDKSGYIPVISRHCNICNDDLDERLIDFIESVF